MKLAIAFVLALMLTACGNELKTLSNSSELGSEILDDGIVNQAAKINCDLYLNNETIPFRKISTISSTDTFSKNAKAGDSVKFNCAKTEDEDAVSTLSFSLDQDYQPSAPNFAPVAGNNFESSNVQVGRHPMALKVVDSEGKERIKTFTNVVECVEAQTPALNISGVTITPGAKLNHFNYAINTSAVSGGEGFQYAWDFNGDYVFDSVSLDNPNEIWTSQSSLANIYSIFVTEGSESRQISVKVKNNCEKESTYTVQARFPNQNIDRTPAARAVERGYFYLQADLAATSGGASQLLDQRKNGDLLVTQYPEDTALRRIECDYKKTTLSEKAVFTMNAYNHYKEGEEFQHGLEIQVRNITDLLTVGTQEITGADLAVAKYKASAADDGIISETYDKVTGCTLTMRVRRDVGVIPCAANERAEADYSEAQAITILGEFACPLLRDSNTLETVKLDNGKFFCQVAPVDQCVGGGGGGGGVPPPEQ